jgi:hypothetical protein
LEKSILGENQSLPCTDINKIIAQLPNAVINSEYYSLENKILTGQRHAGLAAPIHTRS